MGTWRHKDNRGQDGREFPEGIGMLLQVISKY